MNKITFRLKQHLNCCKRNGGFTLIELLVVVIIMGVLAATSLPTLLRQVGKARETEAKSILGTLNRSQQSYFTETGSFAGAGELDKLGVPIGNTSYYTFSVVARGVQKATGQDNIKYGTRNYLGATQFTTDNRSYQLILCRSINQATNYDIAATDVINAGVKVSTDLLACNTTNSESAN